MSAAAGRSGRSWRRAALPPHMAELDEDAALAAALQQLGLGQLLLQWIGWQLSLDQSLLIGGLAWPPSLWWVPALALGVSLAAAALPTLGAYRVSVQELLQSR